MTKEMCGMKMIGKRKWLLVAAALAVFLSVGTVAWTATSDDSAAATGTDGATCLAVTATAADGSSSVAACPGSAVRKALREKGEQWLKRHAALMEKLRDDMTAEDRATYDQLVEKAEQQRLALQQAREDLADTVKQLRELVDEYLDSGSSTTS